MRDIRDEIYDAVHEAESNHPQSSDWPVYVPTDRMDDVKNVLDEYTHMEVYEKGATIAGKQIIPDPFVDTPVVLPTDATDVPLYETYEDPPKKLIEQLVELYTKSSVDKIRRTTQFVCKVFYNVLNDHRRVNEEKIRQYNLAGFAEYDREPDHLEHRKFGYQFTVETAESMDTDTLALSELSKSVANATHDVERRGVYTHRTRTIKGAFPVLDIEHTERIRVGTDYTHYGGVLLTPIDTHCDKIELPEDYNLQFGRVKS